MKGRTVRFAVAAGLMLALCLAMASSAFAAVHVTSTTAFSDSLTASLESTGDSGWNHGNQNWGTSPVLPTPATGFGGWFNQNVMFSNLVVIDPDADGDIIITDSTYQHDSDAATPFTDSANVSAEGLYSLVAHGADDSTLTPDFVATGTIAPAFGIDKTKPVSMSDLPAVPAGDPDAMPVFMGNAIVTISATDALSGVENLQYSVDGGPMDFAWDADPGSAFAVPVEFTTPGVHTLSWRVFDNAGNVDSHTVVFWVRAIDSKTFVGMNVRQSGSRGRTVRFFGEVTPFATAMPMQFTIQRRSGTHWVGYLTFGKTLPKFWDDYSATRTIGRAGTFRVRVTVGNGTSAWRTFKTR